ncbi:unnamed protein product [Dibothriocephalus latus]|uniref:Uncharacterized protein n=1 Tax=Dibothriocephalus latus TaxID=60516 RepID=A0A3P6UUT4_DIBLA|nr:unnamed protein product [Dibothriocephalus latus]
MTARVVRELTHYKVDIFALSEPPQRKKVGVGCALFWNGRPRVAWRETGVTSTIRNNVMSRLSCLPQKLNDHLSTMKLPLLGNTFASSVIADAPIPIINLDDVKNKLYKDLQVLLANRVSWVSSVLEWPQAMLSGRERPIAIGLTTKSAICSPGATFDTRSATSVAITPVKLHTSGATF